MYISMNKTEETRSPSQNSWVGMQHSGRARDLQSGGPRFESLPRQVKPRKRGLDLNFVVDRTINPKISFHSSPRTPWVPLSGSNSGSGCARASLTGTSCCSTTAASRPTSCLPCRFVTIAFIRVNSNSSRQGLRSCRQTARSFRLFPSRGYLQSVCFNLKFIFTTHQS